MLAGENDNRLTYERAAAPAARHGPGELRRHHQHEHHADRSRGGARSAVVAIVEEQDSVDILELSGATSVLPLKHQLGDYLANRVDVGRPEAHVVGEFRGLQIAELPAHDHAASSARPSASTKLRQQTGLSVVGFWERGKLRPAYPQTEIQPDSVLVVAGTAAQIAALNALLPERGRRRLRRCSSSARARSARRRRESLKTQRPAGCTRSIGARRP